VINLHIFHSVSLVQVRTWPSKNVSATLVLLIARTCRSALSNCPSVSISTDQSSAGDCVPSSTMFCCLFVFSVGYVIADRFRFFSLRHYLMGGLFLLCFLWFHCWCYRFLFWLVHKLASLEMRHISVADFLDCLSS
jgi:hypothetical protein